MDPTVFMGNFTNAFVWTGLSTRWVDFARQNRECLRGLVLSNISLPDQWEGMTQPRSGGAQKRNYIARDKYTHTVGVKDMTDIQHEMSQ